MSMDPLIAKFFSLIVVVSMLAQSVVSQLHVIHSNTQQHNKSTKIHQFFLLWFIKYTICGSDPNDTLFYKTEKQNKNAQIEDE